MDQLTGSLHSFTDGEDTRFPKKRPRPVMSCLECRKKKLKCDRLLPCHQCKKSGKATRCAYAVQENSPEPQDIEALSVRKKARLDNPSHQKDDHESRWAGVMVRGENHINTFTTPRMVADVEDLKTRVAQLERMLTNKLPHPGGPDVRDKEAHSVPQPNAVPDSVRPAGNDGRSIVGMLVTKGNRSQYHAPDQKLPMLSRFEEVMKVLWGFSQDPAAAYAIKAIKSAQKLQAIQLKSMENPPWNDLSSVHAAMRAVLPLRHVCERLASIYFTCCESRLRILHRPSFYQNCESFWDHEQELPHPSNSFINDETLPQLVGVLLIASSLSVTEGWTPTPLSTQILYDSLKSWKSLLNSKRRLQLPTLQTQCLLLLVQQIRPTDSVLLQNDSAALVRSAIVMGLHRDPSEFPKLSVFEGELRRRMWFTIVELDMQISYTSGGRPTVRYGDFSTSLAATLDDEEIFIGLVELPSIHVDKVGILRESLDVNAERHSYACLASTIQHRLKAFDFINQAHLGTSEEALKQGREFETARDLLREKLAKLSVSTIGCPTLSEGEILNFVLVYVYTLRPLLSIYRQHGFRGSGNHATRSIEESCVESSMDILSFLGLLRSAQYETGHKLSSFDVFNVLCKVDIMQAALTVCFAAQEMDEESPARRSYRSIDAGQMWTRGDLIERVHMAVNGLLDRKHEPIHDIRDPVCLAVIAQYILHIDNPHTKEAKMHQGAQNTINLYLEALRQSAEKSFFSADFTFEVVSITHGVFAA